MLHLARLFAHRVPPSWMGVALRLTREVALGQPVAAFEREGRPPLPVFASARDLGKDRWRLTWWPTRSLLALRRRGVDLSADLCGLIDELEAARTLPQPLDVYADALEPLAVEHEALFERLDRVDERLGRRPLVPVPSASELETTLAMYRTGASSLLADLERYDALPAARFLEIGCGRGYLAAALAGKVEAEVHGVDVDVVGETPPSEVRRVHELLGDGRDASVLEADATALPFPDGSFEVVFSVAVVEHLVELRRTLEEMRRVLRRGGVAYHTVDPWFGPAGGHSLCTLDAPWGHVRLDGDEFARYVREFRPYEAADAIERWVDGFQAVRLTLAQTADAARAAGFEVLEATRTPLAIRSVHRSLYSGAVLRDCRHLHPAVTAGDLLALSTKLVLRRR